MSMSHRVLAVIILVAAGLSAASAREQMPVKDSGRYSDAEKAFVPPAAVTKVATVAPRRATLQVVFGKKFAPAPGGPVTIVNPYLDPANVFFVQMAGLVANADGSLVVAGRAGLDKAMHALASGYWRIAPDGAITPLYTRSPDTYGKTPATKCEAPYSRTHLEPENFALMPGGAIVKATDFALVRIGTDGFVKRLAGAPFACEELGQASKVRGDANGAADLARFDRATKVLVDPQGNTWILDQVGCALRRLAPDGQVSTLISPEQACGKATPQEDRPALDLLAWDQVHGELVTAWSRPVALPVHNLYTTVWRIKPSGDYRRVLYGTKVGKSPAKHLIDGVSAMAVDPQGQIHIASRIMKREGGSVLAVLRVDEAGATVVPVTGAAVTASEAEDQPRDGSAARAQFRWIADLSFAPDGTLYIRDEHLIRKLDRSGQVVTWAF
jgi:hypothetical protein